MHLVCKNYTFDSVPCKIDINSKNKKDNNNNICINSSEIYHILLYYHIVFTLEVVLIILPNHCPCPSITHTDRTLHRSIKRSGQKRLQTNSTCYKKCQSSSRKKTSYLYRQFWTTVPSIFVTLCLYTTCTC